MGTESEDLEHLTDLRRKIQTMSDEELTALAAVLKRRTGTSPEDLDAIARQMAQNDAARIRRSHRT